MGIICISKYWEWAGDLMFHYEKFLRDVKIEDAIYASLYTYDQKKDFI